MNKFKKLFLALALLGATSPAFADQGQFMTLQQGYQGLSGPADSLAAMTHDGKGVEMKTLTAGPGVTISGSTGALTLGTISSYVASNKTASFAAVPGSVYFVTASATATLPTAVGIAGQEICFVNNAASGVTITYATTNSQLVNGAAPSTNATAYLRDNFISTGTSWIKK